MTLDAESKQKLSRCLIQLQDYVYELNKGLECANEILADLLDKQDGDLPKSNSNR